MTNLSIDAESRAKELLEDLSSDENWPVLLVTTLAGGEKATATLDPAALSRVVSLAMSFAATSVIVKKANEAREAVEGEETAGEEPEA